MKGIGFEAPKYGTISGRVAERLRRQIQASC
jgi:hypothetical protein